MFPPERIVCLTEETVETLYLLGEQDRIAGIPGYCVRPPQARREKPRVSAFTSADIPKILNLRPDLVLSFSDLQAEIVAALVRQGHKCPRLQSAQPRGDFRHDPHVGGDG
jgi:iron complex transport system substrate-binding protein